MSGKPIDEAVVELAAEAYVLNGRGGGSCSHSAMRAALEAVANALTAAQQQGQAVAEVVQEADGVNLRFVGPILPAGTKLYTTAPPSAPVGVEWLCRVYSDAYHAGHHATVEGCYVDVLPVDRDTYWREKVEEDYPEALAQQPAAVVDGWRLVIRYGEYDNEPGVWAEKDGSFVWVAALATQHQEPPHDSQA